MFFGHISSLFIECLYTKTASTGRHALGRRPFFAPLNSCAHTVVRCLGNGCFVNGDGCLGRVFFVESSVGTLSIFIPLQSEENTGDPT